MASNPFQRWRAQRRAVPHHSESINPERLIAFSDAVVAIAITLLILPLVGLELPKEKTANPIAYIWTNNASLIVSFLITWAVIIKFWLTHSKIFRMFEQINPRIVAWNIVWLFGIIVLPFPLSISEQFTEETETFAGNSVFAIYIGTMAVISISLSAIKLQARKNPELLTEATRKRGTILSGTFSETLSAYFVLLTFLALLFGDSALVGLVGLFIVPNIVEALNKRRVRRKQSRADSAAQGA